MKFISLMASLILALTLSFASATQYETTDGQQIDFSQQRGKWIIVNYWASWCGACVSELPVLNKLYDDYADQDKLLLVGVHWGNSDKQDLIQIQQKLGIRFPQLLQDPRDSISGMGRFKFIPYAVFINPNGEVVKTVPGVLTRQMIDSIISSKP